MGIYDIEYSFSVHFNHMEDDVAQCERSRASVVQLR